MARSTKNVIVEENGGTHKEYPQDAPAQETVNARVDIIGPFRHAALTAGLSATPLILGADAAAPTTVLAHSNGNILGVLFKSSVLITAGGTAAVIYQPQVAPGGANPANQGSAANLASAASGNPQTGVVDQTAPVPFNKGDALGITVATNGALAPTTMTPDVYLVVRYAASPGSPP